MKRLCQYAGIAGKPGKGFHVHIFGIAIFDLLGTILLSKILSYLFRTKTWIIFVILLIVAEILHYIFCVPTTIMKLLGLVK